jgi:hypothetical protein
MPDNIPIWHEWRKACMGGAVCPWCLNWQRHKLTYTSMADTTGTPDKETSASEPQAANSQPVRPVGPPSPPGPGASRYEWRAWRRQQHDFVRAQWHEGHRNGTRGWWGGGWFIGAALVVIGVYYLLYALGLLKWLPGDILWPALLILLGLWLLFRPRRGWWR